MIGALGTTATFTDKAAQQHERGLCGGEPPNSKRTRKTCKEIICFTLGGSQFYRGFKKHDLITCESKVPRELVTFVRPWELVSFNPRRVMRFPIFQSDNVFELGGTTKLFDTKQKTIEMKHR